jgi:hypothetical protein
VRELIKVEELGIAMAMLNDPMNIELNADVILG